MYTNLFKILIKISKSKVGVLRKEKHLNSVIKKSHPTFWDANDVEEIHCFSEKKKYIVWPNLKHTKNWLLITDNLNSVHAFYEIQFWATADCYSVQTVLVYGAHNDFVLLPVARRNDF